MVPFGPKRQPHRPTMGVRGEIDKSGWHLIKPSRKEAKYYQMNLSFMEMESLVDVEKAVAYHAEEAALEVHYEILCLVATITTRIWLFLTEL